MATAPVKKPLHNFPKKLLQWTKLKDTNHHHRPATPSPSLSPPPSSFPVGSRSSRPRRESPKPPPLDPTPPPPPPAPHEDNESHRNLRPRRVAVQQKTVVGVGCDGVVERVVPNGSEMINGVRGGGFAAVNGGTNGGCGVVSERRESMKRKIWIVLSKDEIEEDIYSMTGAKPSRRPKKRPKIVQKHLDNMSPGLWLVGLSADSYRTFEAPPKK